MADSLPPLSRYQKFESVRMSRADLKSHPCNPRMIGPAERRRLKGIIKKGLLNALVYNKRSGLLVSGHQRLSVLDDLHGGDAYSLDMDVCDLDSKAEKAALAAFNNMAVMGVWDLDKLGTEFTPEELDLGGFDSMDLQALFEGTEYADKFCILDDGPRGADKELAERQRVTDEARRAEVLAGQAARDEGDDTSGDADNGSNSTAGEHEKRSQEQWREHRAEIRKAQNARIASGIDDMKTQTVIVFGTREEKAAVARRLGRSADEDFIDGRVLAAALGIDLPRETQI